MKILVVTQYFWPEHFRINDLVQGLTQGGHNVTVLTGFPNYPTGKIFPPYRSFQPFAVETYHGARIVRVWLYPNHSLSFIGRIFNYGSFVLMATLLGPCLCGRNFDCIFVFQPGPFSVGIPGLFFKVLTKARALIWIQDIWPDGLHESGIVRHRWIINSVRFLTKLVYRGFEKVMVTSPGFKEPLSTMGVPKNRIHYLPQWTEDFYQIVERDDSLGIKEGMNSKFNIMFAGNIGLGQNLDVILEVAELLRDKPDILFVFLGDGICLPSLMQKVKNKGLTNVLFKGRKPPEHMPKYLALADALLVQLIKSPTYSVTIPGKLQSYFASGIPIIAALEGSGAEIIRESGAGIVCEPGCVEALKDAILAMYGNSQEARKAMGLRGRNYYETHFSRPVVLKKLECLLNEN